MLRPPQPSRSVYLDHSATTPLAPEVAAAITSHLPIFGNPSSIYGIAQEAKRLVNEARERVAALVNAKPDEVIFTGSGSEANNLALKGVAFACGSSCHIITSQIEHAAVLATCRALEFHGYEVTYLPVDSGGRVDPDDVRRQLRSTTRLISIMHANNETGIVQPIEEIGAIARAAGIPFHTDAIQTAGKRVLDLDDLNADLLSLTAHKFYGPKGVGALVMRGDTAIEPLIHGGGQERGMRAGTENVLGIIALGVASTLAQAMAQDSALHERKRALRDRLLDGLLALGDVRVNGDLHYGSAGTLNVSFQHVKGDALATALAFYQVAVSTGSACHAHERKPSHVLQAMGVPEAWLFGSIRFSLGVSTTKEDIDYALSVVETALTRLRKMSPLALAGAF